MGKILCLSLIFLLSLFDGICTWIGVVHQGGFELNPFMRMALDWGIVGFFVTKQSLALMVCYLFHKAWGDIRGRYAVAFALGAQSLLALFHILLFTQV